MNSVVTDASELAGDTVEDVIDLARKKIKEGLDLLKALAGIVTG